MAENNLVAPDLPWQCAHRDRLDVAAGKLNVLAQPRELGPVERIRVSIGPTARADAMRVELLGRHRVIVLFEPLAQLADLTLDREHLAAKL